MGWSLRGELMWWMLPLLVAVAQVPAGFEVADVKPNRSGEARMAVDLQPDAIAISLPHATILGVEQKEVEVLAFENGFWNRISAADVEAQLATLPGLARQKAAESGILGEAETALQTQLNDRVHSERPVRLSFQDAAAKD